MSLKMSTFQIRATVHASANSPRAAAWNKFSTSARLSISARKPIRNKNTQKSNNKASAAHKPSMKLNPENIKNKQLNNVNKNDEGQNILSSIQSAVLDSPIEINNFVNMQTNDRRIESGSQTSTTSLSRVTTSPLPFDDENMPPQDFIAYSQGYLCIFIIYLISLSRAHGSSMCECI